MYFGGNHFRFPAQNQMREPFLLGSLGAVVFLFFFFFFLWFACFSLRMHACCLQVPARIKRRRAFHKTSIVDGGMSVGNQFWSPF